MLSFWYYVLLIDMMIEKTLLLGSSSPDPHDMTSDTMRKRWSKPKIREFQQNKFEVCAKYTMKLTSSVTVFP